MEVSSKIEVGQAIIYKGDMANYPGNGAVVALRQNGTAGRMYSVNFGAGKLEPIDTSVSYDIALADGRQMSGVYASRIGGEFSNKTCRFMLGDGMLTGDEVAALLAGVAMKRASDKAKADEAKAAFEAAKAAALEAGKKLGLIPEAEFRKAGKRGSAAAANMRAELKAAGFKCGVKQDGYTCINVVAQADADMDKVKAITSKYKAGSFDGMSDCYGYDPSAWGSVFGDVQYVFVRGE